MLNNERLLKRLAIRMKFLKTAECRVLGGSSRSATGRGGSVAAIPRRKIKEDRHETNSIGRRNNNVYAIESLFYFAFSKSLQHFFKLIVLIKQSFTVKLDNHLVHINTCL